MHCRSAASGGIGSILHPSRMSELSETATTRKFMLSNYKGAGGSQSGGIDR
jgi:hypothetical protein